MWCCECGRTNSDLAIECICKEEEQEIERFLDSLNWFEEFEDNDLTDEQDEEAEARDRKRGNF
jgi:hypothetical protein